MVVSKQVLHQILNFSLELKTVQGNFKHEKMEQAKLFS